MSVGTLIFWLFVAAWIVLLAYLGAALVPRIVRDTLRIIRRVSHLTDRQDIFDAIDLAERNVTRLQRSRAASQALVTRAQTAVGEIRAARFVSPQLRALVARVDLEVQAFRAQR